MTGTWREPVTGRHTSPFWRASVSSVPTTWVNIGPRSAPGSFGSWIFAPRNACATRTPRERGRRHEDVDAELRDVALPDRLRQIDPREVGAETELAAD